MNVTTTSETSSSRGPGAAASRYGIVHPFGLPETFGSILVPAGSWQERQKVERPPLLVLGDDLVEAVTEQVQRAPRGHRRVLDLISHFGKSADHQGR